MDAIQSMFALGVSPAGGDPDSRILAGYCHRVSGLIGPDRLIFLLGGGKLH